MKPLGLAERAATVERLRAAGLALSMTEDCMLVVRPSSSLTDELRGLIRAHLPDLKLEVSRKIFGAACEQWDEEMNQSRMRELEANQSGIARKVLDAVPKSESWTVGKVCGEIVRATGANPDMRIVSGCLKTLIDSGLVREPERGKFIRVTVKPAAQPVIQTEEKMPVSHSPEKKVQATAAEPIDRLATIAKTMRALATEAEEIAMDVTAQIEQSAAQNARFRQLQALLKGD